MTSEALREAVADKIAEYTGTPDGPTKYVIAQQILQLIATSLPEKRPVKPFDPDKDITQAMWADITNMNSGFNEAIDDFLKLLGGGDNGK